MAAAARLSLCGFQASYLGSSGRILGAQEAIYGWYGPFSALKSCTGGRSPMPGPDLHYQVGNPPKYSGFYTKSVIVQLDFLRAWISSDFLESPLVVVSMGSGWV